MAAVAALLILYDVMAVSAVSQKSMTFDEMAHLTGGYTTGPSTTIGYILRTGTGRSGLPHCQPSSADFLIPGPHQPAGPSSNVYVMGDKFLYFERQRCRRSCCVEGVRVMALARRGAGCPCLRVVQTTGVADRLHG